MGTIGIYSRISAILIIMAARGTTRLYAASTPATSRKCPRYDCVTTAIALQAHCLLYMMRTQISAQSDKSFNRRGKR